MKTDKEINEEVSKLKKLKPTIRRYDSFGTDHWLEIDAQVVALELRYSHEEAYDNFPTYDEEADPIEANAALEAVDWMNDENDATRPSDDWETLVIK